MRWAVAQFLPLILLTACTQSPAGPRVSADATRALTAERSRQTYLHQGETHEVLIPYAEIMGYPDNWPEITRKRLGE